MEQFLGEIAKRQNSTRDRKMWRNRTPMSHNEEDMSHTEEDEFTD